VAQFAVMAAIVGAGFLPPHRPGLRLVGGVLAALGAVLGVWAARTMGRSLSPFPRPRADGELIEHGPFRVARHPIYGGSLVFFVGYAVATSVAALVPTAALGVLWLFKSRAEERLLAQRFAGYAEYRRRVRGRFLPGL
jgi:protein-S-isoprenylcysteine O-methyltransferase Ste14